MNQYTSPPVALITGVASGIGQALALKYAKLGVRVVGGYLESDVYDPDVTAQLVKEQGGECLLLPSDVTNSLSLDQLAQAAIKTYGRLDYAIANAGLLRRAPLVEMSDQNWHEMLDVDLSGVMRTFRAAVKQMTHGGALVAVSSIAGGVYGWQDHCHYAAAKAGVLGLCRSLAVELAAKNIRCNAVIPGLIETPQSLDPKNSLGSAGLAKVAPTIPLGRVGKAADIANVISFLTSEDADYLTGQSMIIDGGLSIKWPD